MGSISGTEGIPPQVRTVTLYFVTGKALAEVSSRVPFELWFGRLTVHLLCYVDTP